MNNIVMLPVSALKPYEKNPRNNKEAVDKVAASLREFGFRQPIVVDNDYVIIAGHTRLLAAKKLKLREVPVLVADDLTDEQAKAYRLADNKTAEFAEWDSDLLNEELADILDIDMTDFGFEIDLGEDEQEEEQEPEEENPFDNVEKLDVHYGVPYQGNKSRIADIIINILPSGKRLVDLFGGGGAITHCAMLSNKWDSFLYNDLNDMITGLFVDAIYGAYHDEHRVITRADFEALKDTDAYVKYIWSFGNNGTGYLWGKDIEEVKCQACRMMFEENVRDRRLAFVSFIKMLEDSKDPAPHRLAPIERLESLEKLEALQRLEVSNIDYHTYEYHEGDIVYCDVPYEQLGKAKCDDYGVNFDSLEFYEWVKAQPYQVFFSSYEISDDSFYSVKVKSIQSLIGANTNGKKVNEYLYSNQPILIDDQEQELPF